MFGLGLDREGLKTNLANFDFNIDIDILPISLDQP